jgi:hypothetical protein
MIMIFLLIIFGIDLKFIGKICTVTLKGSLWRLALHRR